MRAKAKIGARLRETDTYKNKKRETNREV